MIELLSQALCIGCNACVTACPMNVFDKASDREPGAAPVIARPDDCQTCFMCELYCPTDALYVSPLADKHETVDETQLAASGRLGSFQREMGWREARPGNGTETDLTYRMFADGRVKP